MFTGIGLISFFSIACAAALGFFIGRRLPEDNRSDSTQRTVQLVMNAVAILSALVLGLLVASAKTNFDTTTSEVEQFSASLSLLDRDLSRLGSEGAALRGSLRDYTTKMLTLTWPTLYGGSSNAHLNETEQILDDMQDQLRSKAQADAQVMTRASALQIIGELRRTSRLLILQESIRTPRPFLAIVIFWLGMLYLSYAVFAPPNRTVVGAMIISAISVSIALNVIVDMDRPFVGFVKVSPTPVRQALDQMNAQ
ncbi:MAG TPA: hypothetical protein VKS78_19480 [Roseiarcus sp.]|nr:hypothetical protein [Roseiarcus sp.]